MLIDCFVSLRNAKKRNNVFLFSAIAWIVTAASLGAHADVGSTLDNLPVFKIQIAQKNSNGDTYRIGDRITLYVELPQEIQNQHSSFDISAKDETALGEAGWYLDTKSNFISGNLQFVVSPIQVGALTLPSLLIQNQQKVTIAKTDTWAIKVVGENLSPEDQQKKAEFLPYKDILLSGKIWFFLFLTLLFIIVLCIFGYRYYKSKRTNTKLGAPIAPKVINADHVIALRALNKLYSSYPYSNDNLKPVAFGTSEILKFFFSSRFKVDARESTSAEMLALLKKSGLSDADLKEIDDLFKDLDLIKFTRGENYQHIKEIHYQKFKDQAELLIKKWALPDTPQTTGATT